MIKEKRKKTSQEITATCLKKGTNSRRTIDVVYEIFLKYGVPLTEELSTLEIQSKTFCVLGQDDHLFICLDKDITVEIEEAGLPYAPGTTIFSDQCFASDNDITNVAMSLGKAILKLGGFRENHNTCHPRGIDNTQPERHQQACKLPTNM